MEILRWIVSAVLGVGISMLILAFVFATMNDMGAFITVLKAIPTAFTDTSAECGISFEQGRKPVAIKGLVGTQTADGFRPLAGVEILEASPTGNTRLGESASDGSFDVEAGFLWHEQFDCGAPVETWEEGSKPVLFRAKGCDERRVPVTQDWIPHRITLTCS